jgi:hypothetical protein
MCLGGEGTGSIGASLLACEQWAPGIAPAGALFGEAGGFVVAVASKDVEAFERIAQSSGARPVELGHTGGSQLRVAGACDIPLSDVARAWMRPLQDLFA